MRTECAGESGIIYYAENSVKSADGMKRRMYMRFFKPELWIITQDLRLSRDNPYIQEWTNNFELYELEYKKSKQLLSKKFIRIYERAVSYTHLA